MNLTIHMHGDRIALSGQTYVVREAIKAIPGHRWDPDGRLWTFPCTMDSYRLVHAMFPFAKLDGSMHVLAEQARKLEDAMLAKHDVDAPPVPVEKSNSWLHQRQAFWFAYHRLQAKRGAMLALDMGCGKSKVAIDLINNLDCRHVLITCPTSVVNVWPEQFEVHSHITHPILACNNSRSIERRTREAKDFLWEHGGGVVVINHEAVWRKPTDVDMFGGFALGHNWDMVIVDECHRAKSPGGKLSRYLYRLAQSTRYRLGLTGTPAPHSILDIYAQARFLDDSVFGTNYTSHRAEFAIVSSFGTFNKVVGFKNTDKFSEKFHELAIQMKAEDTLDLPDKVHMNRYCELSAPERRAYDDMKKEMIAEVKGGTITAANALVRLLRLAQIVQGTVTNDMGTPVVVGESKRELLRDVLEDIEEPVVVFCRFTCDIDTAFYVAGDLGRPCFQLSGERKQLDEWKAACAQGQPAIIAVQIQAGGVGISMVQARYCIYLSKGFNLGEYEQSLARVHRPGQSEKVTYIHLVAKGTIDEVINRALAQRKDTVEMILTELGGAE